MFNLNNKRIKYVKQMILLIWKENFLVIIDKYLAIIRVEMFSMKAIHNQSISESNMNEKSKDYMAHLRKTLVENGDIKFDEAMDRKGLLSEEINVFVEMPDRRRILI